MSDKGSILEASTSQSRLVKVSGEWWAFAIVVIAIIGFAVATPRFAGPDEAAHQATAWYTISNGMPVRAEGKAFVPSIFGDEACFAFERLQDASCVSPRETGKPESVRVLNYPPPYYWATGIGQRIAGALSSEKYLDLGGKAASVLLNLVILTLIALLARRHYRQWGTYLLLVVTPMAAFLWATVNPSGWEIATGLLFAYLFARAWWSNDDEPTSTSRWPSLLSISISSVLFASARHSAIVWMAGVMVAVATTGRSLLPRNGQWWTLLSTVPGFLFGIAWQLTHPAIHKIRNPDHIDNPGLLNYANYFVQIEEMLPVRLRQMVGVLGKVDTPVPQWIFFLIVVGWVAFIGFLFARTSIPIFFLVVGFLGTFLVPTVMEALRWNDWPFWYQGRITLPFTIPFLFLLLLKYANNGQRAAASLSVVTGGVLTFMVWQNLMRYSFGIWVIPERWTDPAIPGWAFWLTHVCIALMLAGLIYRVVLVVRWNRTAGEQLKVNA